MLMVVPALVLARVRGSAGLGLAGLGLAAVVALGCSASDEETCEIVSEEMSAVALVIDSGFDIRVSVDFELGDRRGQGEPLRLCDSDRLTINGRTPTEIGKASRIEYAIDLEADGERSFAFVLEREDQEERIAFDIELPAPLEFLEPTGEEPVSVGEGQTVQWEPAVEGETIELSMSEALGGYECLESDTPGHDYERLGGVRVPDTGQWEIPAGAVGTDSPQPCMATYTLTRITRGSYPEQLERGGRVEARVERYRDVTIIP